MAYTPEEQRYLEAVKTQEFGSILGDLQAPDWRSKYPNFSWNWLSGKNPRVVDQTTGQLLQTGDQPSGGFGFEDYILPALMAATGFGAAGMGPLGGAGAAGAGAASAPIDWTTATAGGVADTGFGAETLPSAPWGAGEAVSGTYPGLEAGASEAGGLGSGLNQNGGKVGVQATPSQSYSLGSPVGTTTTPAAGSGIASPSVSAGAGTSAWDTIKQGIQMVNTVSPILGLGAAIAGRNQANSATDQLQNAGLNNQYPYGQNFDLVNQYNRDPMSLLRNNPGYLASVDYTAKAQQRQNAATGRNTSGYGDFLMADVLGKNAENWWKDAWQPIRDSAGLTNPGAQLNAQTNAINSINNTKRTSLADMWNQGTKVATQTLPEIFKWLS